MEKVQIPHVATASSISSIARELQPVLDQLAVALPDFFVAAPTETAGAGIVTDDATPVAVVTKPKRAKKVK